MANQDIKQGLRPLKALSGEFRTNNYYVPASYGTALFIGDPVVITGTANTSNVIANGRKFPAGSLPEISKANAGDTNAFTGVIVGFLTNFDNMSIAYKPASTEAIAIVADAADQEYLIQEESGGSPLGVTSVGLNTNLVFTKAGSTATGFSGAELNNSTLSTSATFQLKILRLFDEIDNEIGKNAKWVVKNNNSTQSNATTGV